MGGLNPLYEPLPGCIPPPRRGGAMGLGRGKPSSGRVQGTTPLGALGTMTQGANPKGQPFGVSPRILPRWPP